MKKSRKDLEKEICLMKRNEERKMLIENSEKEIKCWANRTKSPIIAWKILKWVIVAIASILLAYYLKTVLHLY